MKVALVLPPLAWPFSPYLGLPALAAYLRGLGHQVAQFDANLRLFERAFSRAGLEQFSLVARDRFRQLEGRSSLNLLEQEEYLDLLECRLVLPRYLDRVEAIKAAFRDLDCYRLLPDGTVPLEQDWMDYKVIRHLMLPDETNRLGLPVASLAGLRAALEGQRPLVYQPFLEELAQEIAALGPELLGFSLTFSEQAIPGLILARLVKDRLPRTHVVMGGFYFSALHDGLEQVLPGLGWVDSVVPGEGEQPLATLAAALERGGGRDQVPGLVWVEDGRVRSSPPPPPLDVDGLPCPDFEGLPLDSYFAARPVLPYATARGCYWGRCAFCSFCLISPRFRVRSPRLVAQDLSELCRTQGQLFYLAQEAEPPRRMEEIAQALLEEGVPARYQLFARFEKSFSARTAELLRRSGCLYVFFGLEAGSDRVNRLMRKGIDLGHARRIVADCASAGLNVVVSSIRGFPTETPAEWGKTQEFYREIRGRHGGRIRLTGGSHLFRLPRGSAVDRSPQDFGISRIFREAAGELATVFPAYQLEGDPDGSRLLQLERQFEAEYPLILYNEIIVLIITDQAGGEVIRFATVRPREAEPPRPGPPEFPRSDGARLRLAPGVGLERLAFPVARMRRWSRERKRRARELFVGQGRGLEEVVAGLEREGPPVGREPSLLLTLARDGRALTLALSAQAAPLLERLAQGATSQELAQGGDPGLGQRVDALLQELHRQGVLVAEAPPREVSP